MADDMSRRMTTVTAELDATSVRLGRTRRTLDGEAVVAGLDQLLGPDGFWCTRVLDTRAAEVVWVASRSSDGARFEASSPTALVRVVDAFVHGV